MPARVAPDVAGRVTREVARRGVVALGRPGLVLLAGLLSACQGDEPGTSGAGASRAARDPHGWLVRALGTALPGAGADARRGADAGSVARKGRTAGSGHGDGAGHAGRVGGAAERAAEPGAARAAEPGANPGADTAGVASAAADVAGVAGVAPAAGASGTGVAPATGPTRITVMAVGDVLFGRYTDRETYLPVVVPGHDDPFADVASILHRADVALANVESPVLNQPADFWVHGRLTFRAGPEALPALDAAGFDVLSFANNHALNFGAHGLRETLAHVDRTRLRAVGIGLDQAQADGPVLIESAGVRVAVLGRTTWLNARRLPSKDAAIAYVSDRDMEARVAADVRQVRASGVADVVIVYVHWGRERAPRPGNHQRWAAHAMIDAGADLVIGHHPHVVQAVERHGNGLIAYSLGNFLFDNGLMEQRRSVILEVTLEVADGQRRVHEAVLHPVLVDRIPRRLPGRIAKRVPVLLPEDRMWMPRLARGRDYRIWARMLAELAPGIAIAPEPAAEAPVVVEAGEPAGVNEPAGASEPAGVVAPARLAP